MRDQMHVNHSSTRGTAIVVFLVRSYEIQATQNAFRVFVLPRGMLGDQTRSKSPKRFMILTLLVHLEHLDTESFMH